MLINTASNPFWFIAGCAGLWAFLDFWIGKKGQKKTKDWLELHWYHFVDVDVRNFAAQESLRCIRIFDKLFGASLLSWRRLASTVLVLIFAFGAFALLASRHGGAYATIRYALFEDSYAEGTLLRTVVVLPILFALSLSLTRRISVMAIRIAGIGKTASSNIIVFVALVLIHYEILALWGPLFRNATQMSAPYAISADLGFFFNARLGNVGERICRNRVPAPRMRHEGNLATLGGHWLLAVRATVYWQWPAP